MPEGFTRAEQRLLAEQRRTLRGVLWAGTLVLALLTVTLGLLRLGAREALLVYGTGVVLHLGHLAALRVVGTRAVAVSFCLCYLVWITAVLAFRTGGLQPPAAFVYPPIVLFAGLVWSGWAAVAMAISSSACGAALVLLEQRGLLPPSHEVGTPLMLWILLSACVAITATMLHFSLGIIRRSTDEALRSEERFADLVRAAPDAMLFITPELRVRACNAAAESLTGYSAAELCGRRLDSLVGADETERREMSRHLAAAIEGHPAPALDVSLRSRDGRAETVPVELRVRRAAADASGELHVTLRDLRDRARAEQRRQALEEQLRQAQRLEAIGRLAGGVAHDFNNLLTVIVGNIDLLEYGAIPAEQSVKEIRVAATRAAAITRQLMAVGRRQVLTPTLIDLTEVIRELQPLLVRLLPEDISLRIASDPSPCRISGDRTQLEQVLLNLVANARDALPRGGVITVGASATAPEGHGHDPEVPEDAVWLKVADDGVGMSDEVKDHLFEPFFTTKGPHHGTGLGLATVHGIVSQTGGKIVVDTQQGRGTLIGIVFPRALGTISSEARHALAAKTTSPGSRLVVLVVEDDPAVRAVTCGMLRSAQYAVLEADSRDEALAVSDYVEGPIHLVITDVVMRETSGLEVARALGERRPNVKILFMSGHAEELIAQKGVPVGGLNFLQKPFTQAALLDKVREVMASAGEGHPIGGGEGVPA